MFRFLAIAGAALALFPITAAYPSIMITSGGPPTPTGFEGPGEGFYAYKYNVQLTNGQLDPTRNGAPVQFGTVYDFGPITNYTGVFNNPPPGITYISETGLLADSRQFTFTFDGSDTPASVVPGFTYDDPRLTNVRFNYTGSTGVYVSGEPTTLGASAIGITTGNANLGTFTVYSPFSSSSLIGRFDGRSYNGVTNTAEASYGVVRVPFDGRNPLPVPVFPSAAPEPASWALLLTGFAMVGTRLRRRNVASCA